MAAILPLCCQPPSTSALKFNFTAFTGGDTNITYEEAFPADNAIQLTRNLLGSTLNSSVGRATYNSPLPLWDPISRNLTDFQTHFVFSIFSQFKDGYGDGFAFFLAPFNSKLPPATPGGTLGLTDGPHALNTTANHFVAVEFDIFSNDFDPLPLGRHLGIDVNSLRSVKTIPWGADVMGGRRSEAWISYDSSTHNLSVAVSGFVRDFGIVQRLSHIIDLREFLPEQVRFGFCGSTGDQVAIHRIHSWDFASTLELKVAASNRTGERSSDDKNSGLVGGIVAVFALLICFRKRIVGLIRKNGTDDGFEFDEMDEAVFEKGAGPSKFCFKELARATNNFNEKDYKLGEGGFGKVYKGCVKVDGSKQFIAVKRVSSRKSGQGMKEFAAEVKIISRLRHRNLVQLLGWCNEKKELLLVYEFLPNGSLDSHLFQKMKESSLLNWETRYKIAKGLASGLLYLHEEWEQCVVHRDIKSSNIMLDSNFNAKLGDFGLARLVDHDKGSQTTLLAGTMGYLAPECVVTGKASRESDVFSFGVVLLEIATGRRPAVKVEGDGKLVEWVWELYGDGRLTMMEGGPDRRLDGEYDVEEMERLLMVGLCCAHPDSSSRPSVRQAVQLLNFEAPVPVLPVNMPVASYGGGDQMREGSFGVSTSTMMTMADADLQRRHVSCDFDGSNGVATSPLGKNGSNNAVTF
ncbi:L-type lectin-domain containing receptor kinase IX.1 [Linum grandiflorum]